MDFARNDGHFCQKNKKKNDPYGRIGFEISRDQVCEGAASPHIQAHFVLFASLIDGQNGLDAGQIIFYYGIKVLFSEIKLLIKNVRRRKMYL